MEGEVSMILGYVLKCNYDLPYNASDFAQQRRWSRLKRSENDFALSRTTTGEGYMTRWTLYGMLESTLERFDKACLLRIVYESTAYPFDKGHGFLGELLHVLLTPSTTREEYEIYSNPTPR
ncbi:uncharacterized protein LOC114931035 [Nylanderia fulva]|uniref:uncharacterized protein LOC114931035 n=1 Tax=Nylanderia fulva TaxID=613905 RepID=UPI0010FB533F|nr:uncharacterized protein LOC114931035 [Nylanderia fulva]